MAQFLYERHSTKVHLNAAKRHMRLARQIKGAEEFATAIEPACNELAEKAAATTLATENCETKRDLVILMDSILDDKLRDVSEGGKKYDRDNPGTDLTTLLFPQGLSSMIYAPLASEPAEADKVVLALRSLGSDHPLNAHILPLQTAINDCKNSLNELHVAITAEKSDEALEAIAKLNLTRKYAQNIHAASLKFGKQFINRLFPAIRIPKKSEEADSIADLTK